MKIVVLGPCSVESFLPSGRTQNLDEDHRFSGSTYICQEYIRQGHTVSIVRLSKHVSEKTEWNISGGGKVVLVPRRTQGSQLIRDMWKSERRALASAVCELNSDVLHANWTYEYALAMFETEMPYLLTAHDVPSRIFGMMKPRWYWWPRLYMGWRNGIKAKRLTSVSPYAVQCWQGEMGRKGPTDMIPNSVPESMIQLGDLPRSRTERQKNESPVFVSVANGFAGRKNTQTLVRAFALVRKVYPTASLLLIGAGHGTGEIAEKWSKARGLTDGVQFIGSLPKHDELLTLLHQRADVLVHAALEESFGMTVVEAQALGIPVIGGQAAGAVPWLLDGGLGGTLCDVTSDEALSLAMKNVIRSFNSHQIAYARLRLRTAFSQERVGGMYLESLQRSL